MKVIWTELVRDRLVEAEDRAKNPKKNPGFLRGF